MGFDDLRKKILASGDAETKDAVAASLAAAMLKLVADGFLQSRDPYEVAWKPVRRRGKPLQKSGRMYRSSTASASGPRATVAITANYSGYHQRGTRAYQVNARQGRQSARGRFVGRGARTAFLLKIGAHTNPGITARPMVPDERGLPPGWEKVFTRDTLKVLRRRAGV